jgi:hypothetical protein
MQMKVGLAILIVAFFIAVPIVWLIRDASVARAGDDGAEIAQLKAEIEQLKGGVPSQSHALLDVDYHFTNLSFAGQSKNWPLAQFYLNETRSHVCWAVRVIPVRRIPGGEVDLRGLLEAVDTTGLTEIGKAIADKNSEGFTGAYRHTLKACYSCHKASDKPVSPAADSGTPGVEDHQLRPGRDVAVSTALFSSPARGDPGARANASCAWPRKGRGVGAIAFEDARVNSHIRREEECLPLRWRCLYV